MKLRENSNFFSLLFSFQIFLLLIVVGFIFNFKNTEIEKEVKYYFLLDKTNFELGEDVNLKDYIQTNYTVLEYPKINFSKLGNQIITFIVERDDKIEKKQFDIEINDSTKPIISIKSSNIVISEGENIDLKNNISISDNDEFADFYIDYGVLKEGKNSIKVIAKDRSMNYSESYFDVDFLKNRESKLILDKKLDIPNTISEETIINPSPVKNNMKFLFSKGYDFNTAFDNCKLYLNKNGNGTCIPLKNDDGIYLGYEFISE